VQSQCTRHTKIHGVAAIGGPTFEQDGAPARASRRRNEAPSHPHPMVCRTPPLLQFSHGSLLVQLDWGQLEQGGMLCMGMGL